ncbi:hypothetical protein CDIK_2678 [Cucumispora dikerogammari]|nr:hypothetical protein CDIK_2678 [Cucumispora dikerogammari]
MLKLLVKLLKLLFSSLTKHLNYIQTTPKVSDTIKFKNLIKGCHVPNSGCQYDESLKSSVCIMANDTELLYPHYPTSTINKDWSTNSMFIMFPLFKIKGNKGQKIIPSFFEEQEYLNRIFRKHKQVKGYETDYMFSLPFSLDFIKSIKFNGVEIGIEKDHNVRPGYFMFKKPPSNIPTLYMTAFLHKQVFEPTSKTYLHRILCNQHLNNGYVLGKMQKSVFEIVLSLDTLQHGLIVAPILDHEQKLLKYSLKPATNKPDTSFKSDLTVILETNEEEKGEEVFNIIKHFENPDLKNMYLKIDAEDEKSRLYLQKYLLKKL